MIQFVKLIVNTILRNFRIYFDTFFRQMANDEKDDKIKKNLEKFNQICGEADRVRIYFEQFCENF